MGRYYDGDIEGKFWFGIQSSTDGEFFGATQMDNNYIEYRIENEQKDEVLEAIQKCKTQLGTWLEILDEYFNKNTCFSEQKISDFIKDKKCESTINEHQLNIKDYPQKIGWYARLELGNKMIEFFEKNPDSDLYFNAEI